MEREPINREKESRIIQQKRGFKGQVNIVDNRTNSVRSLMRGGKVSQRVIQRVGEASRRKFKYCSDISENNDFVPYVGMEIVFADYVGGEIKSACFHGCYMMAFHFNPVSGDSSAIDKRKNEIKELLSNPDTLGADMFNRTFVAHVANDARAALYDAVQRELIVIETIFRPNNGATKSMLPADHNTKEGRLRGHHQFAAGMIQDGTEWRGVIYGQERKSQTDYEITPIATIDTRQMGRQSEATRAYIIARICIDAIVEEKYSTMLGSLERLSKMKDDNLEVLLLARDAVLLENDATLRFGPGDEQIFRNQEIYDLFNAVISGDRDSISYIEYLIAKRQGKPAKKPTLTILPSPPNPDFFSLIPRR